MLFVIVFLFVAASLYAYVKIKRRYEYFRRRSIPFLKPTFPLGNAADLCLGRKSIFEFQNEIYVKTKKTKLLGLFMFMRPTLYVADLTWIKNILTKDFNYFYDRGLNLESTNEPLTRHLFHLEGRAWRLMRTKVNPMLNAQGIRVLFPLMLDSTRKLNTYMGFLIPSVRDIDMKDVLGRYSADVIGNCAFGIDSQALTNGRTKFYEMSKMIFEPNIRTLIKLMWPNFPYFLSEWFDVKMIRTACSKYFTSILKNEMNRRLSDGADKNDVLRYMMKLRAKEEGSEDDSFITEELIMAQCFMFFIAGFENATGVTCAALFELARHQDVQRKLYEEIREVCLVDENLDVTFDKIEKMTYLDMLASEIIRLYPPATAVIRECVQDYHIPETNIILEKGLQLVIPVVGINRDPTYFPNADNFDPENFSEEAKANRDKYAYIPFGEGPRYCIGQKFGVTQIKIALVYLVSAFQFTLSPKMVLPIEFEKKTFITTIKGGVWLRCQTRTS